MYKIPARDTVAGVAVLKIQLYENLKWESFRILLFK